jgi:signal peptidase I
VSGNEAATAWVIDDNRRGALRQLMASVVGESVGERLPSRWLAAALCVMPGCGAGHFYLGKKRRALLWGLLPPLLYAAFMLALLRTPLPGLHWAFPPAVLFMFLGLRFVMAVDVLVLPASSFRKVPGAHLALFAVGAIAFTVFAQVMVRAHVVEPYRIAGGAMQPTLLPEEHVAIDKGAFRGRSPERGELVIVGSPENPQIHYIERVIALPGDRVEVVDGHPVINGWQVPRCRLGLGTTVEPPLLSGVLFLEYLGSSAYLVFLEDGRIESRQAPSTVAPGELWVLGDNRHNSADSREWNVGAPLENLRGRPAFAWLTFKPNGFVEWSRYGADLKEPRLPPHLEESLGSALRHCLSIRPENTTPP